MILRAVVRAGRELYGRTGLGRAGWRAACAAAALAFGSASAVAELLGTVATAQGTVRLMTDACRLELPAGAEAAKRAYRLRGGSPLEGCWVVDGRGNPVVTWSGGQRQTLDGGRVVLQRKYAVLLEDLPKGDPRASGSKAERAKTPAGSAERKTPPPPPASAPQRTAKAPAAGAPASSSVPAVARTQPAPPPKAQPQRETSQAEPRSEARSPRPVEAPRPPRPEPREPPARTTTAAASDFDRPAWCRSPHLLPHERRVCSDPRLASQDLALAPLWRAFRRQQQLTKAAEAWHKSDFFTRLKACGADDACISREQLARRRFYEQALAAGRTEVPPRP